MTIKIAEQHDLPDILSLYQHLITEEDYSRPADFATRWEEILAQKGLTYFLARVDDAPAACCHISVVPNLSRGQRPYALIENVITHPELRRRGIGQAIMERAIQHACQAGCYKIMLLSTSSHDRSVAHQFYRALGFDGNLKQGFALRLP
jgi:GNAT superfamily N-acetyltransferase